MKRFLALFSAVAVCLSSLSFSYADTSTESDVSAQANDLPPGVELGLYVADVSYAGGGVGPDLPKVGDWVSSTMIPGNGIPPTDPTVQTGYYYIPSFTNADYVYVRITFESATPATSDVVGWFTFDANFLASPPGQTQVPDMLGGFNLSFLNYQPNQRAHSLSPDPLPYRYYLHPSAFTTPSQTSTFYLRFDNTNPTPMYLSNFIFANDMIPVGTVAINPVDRPFYPSASWVTELFEDVLFLIDSVESTISSRATQIVMAIKSIFDKSNDNWDTKDYHNSEIDQAVSDLENQDQQMSQVEDQYLDDFHDQQSSMAGTVSTFQWPSGITSAMAWITIQMNSIWSGLGGNVQMLFTFSMILGLSLIFLGRWRA